MFGKLKEKLKGWVKRNEEKEEIVETTKKENKKKEKIEKREQRKDDKEKNKDVKKKNSKKKEKEIEEEKKKENINKVEEEAVEVMNDFSKEALDNLDLEEEEIIEEEKEKKSFFSKFKKVLNEEKFEELFEELEIILLQNNVAYKAVDAIKERLRKELVGKNLKEVKLNEELKEAIESILIEPINFIEEIKKGLKEKKPYTILFSGINGSGKTTTVAKIANYLLKNKFTVCLAAADTFRAASIEQIQQHADKLKIPLIKKDYGSDPASVGFDAISYAKKKGIDIVLIDTAGRMQNKDSLMREIEKIVRVNKPDMKIFLGESITGNDATEQAKAFNETIELTGIILSKADVDEKGGTAISVSYITGKPILFLGTGQEYDNIEIFDKEKMIKKLGL